MSVNAPIDYTKYFTYNPLTKNYGKPDYDFLKGLKEELKTNATNVVSNLGGTFSNRSQSPLTMSILRQPDNSHYQILYSTRFRVFI